MTRVIRNGHNEEDKVVKQSPIRPSGLSEVQLVNMKKGLFRTWKGLGKDGRRGKRRA